jgi:hypothetical protein
MPQKPSSNRKLVRAALGVALAGAIAIAGASAARAEDDDSLMDKFMKGLGFKKPGDESDISYTERSPLVVPPSRDLPRPITGTAPPVPDWPKDADVNRRKETKKKKVMQTYDFTEDARPLMPHELEQGRRRGADEGKVAPNHGDSNLGQVSQDQLGNRKSIFSFDWLIQKEEYATFTGEPGRASLTEPPVGYRTPSPDQPYGIAPERAKTAAPKSIGERMETQTGR